MIIGIISILMFIFGVCLAIFKFENDSLYWVGYLITMLSLILICGFIHVNQDIILSWFEI
jgi:hypothetical protein